MIPLGGLWRTVETVMPILALTVGAVALIGVTGGVVHVVRRWSLYRFLWRRRYFWFLRKRHDEFNTRIYTGLPGSSKSLWMVRDVIKLMRAGVRVASNMYIQDPMSPPDRLLCTEPCGSWLDMLRLTVDAMEKGEMIIFAFDELQNLCGARDWQKTPRWWLSLMQQRRHYGVGLIGTTQDLCLIEKSLRLLVSSLISVRFVCWRWTRIPLCVGTWLDGRYIDSPEKAAETATRTFDWLPWWAWHGYDTMAVIAVDDFGAYTDDEAAVLIADLTARMQALRTCEGLDNLFHGPLLMGDPDGCDTASDMGSLQEA